jgi:hypothetical protein
MAQTSKQVIVGQVAVELAIGACDGSARISRYDTDVYVGDATVNDTCYKMMAGHDFKFGLNTGESIWAVSAPGDPDSKVYILTGKAG